MPWALSWIKILKFLYRIIFSEQIRISDLPIWPYSEDPCSGIMLLEPLLQTYYFLISENDLVWSRLILMQKDFHSHWDSPMHWRLIFLKINWDSIGRQFWLTAIFLLFGNRNPSHFSWESLFFHTEQYCLSVRRKVFVLKT